MAVKQMARSLAGKAFSCVSGDLSLCQLRDLLIPKDHSSLIQRRRALLILSRVRMVAALFSVLTPLWIVIDVVFFGWPLWGWLAVVRVAASVAFGTLALSYRHVDDIRSAWRAMAWLLAVPTVFFVITHPVLNAFELGGPAVAVSAGYAFLPFVMVAGLSVFPITAIEGIVFATPLLGAHLTAGLYGSMVFPFNSYLGALWLLVLLMVVASFAAMSQLHFMMALVNQASHDVLTGAFSRRIGEELLRLQFNSSLRTHRSLAVVFVDLDNFKSINDRYGHEEGDRTLRTAALALATVLRHSDIMVRWGGEEFVLILANTDRDGAVTAIQRLRAQGLGLRPDGTPQTASIGIAESLSDGAPDWQKLVEVADQRMYQAKQAGRDRICAGADRMIA